MINSNSHNHKKSWKQINFRSVDNMLGVEFLHDLYNRHHPYVNSIRFRNTVLVVKGREVTSYAPTEEWDFVAEWFGERFIVGDEDVYTAIEDELLNFKKPLLHKRLTEFKHTQFESLSNIELGLKLIDIHYFALGEIYKVNLVQVEHALTYAIGKQLEAYFSDPKVRSEAFATLILSSEPTVAGREEILFLQIVQKGLKSGVKKLNTNDENEIMDLITAHHKEHAFVHSAYGADPYTLEDYIVKYNGLATLGEDEIDEKLELLLETTENVKREKKQYLDVIQNDTLLLRNIDIFIRIGVLRDNNKALMGTTTRWRNIILAEIARRTSVSREDINLYFMRELLDLLRHGTKVTETELTNRKAGFGLTRFEGMSLNYEAATEHVLGEKNKITVLKGMCASVGGHKGTVKIIRSSQDVHKINQGDIMVAPGTDFDLINAMQKSGAIVTEEGGILSHASVVSRELGIPCVIGVKGATTLLEDGMIVDVDATNGVINIVKE